MWCLVMDDLLTLLNQLGYETIGYADDLAVIVRSKHGSIISDRTQDALNLISGWYRGEGLNASPDKTILIPFTRKQILNLRTPNLNGIQLSFSKERKYLGVMLDAKLNWKSQIQRIKEKAIRSLMACKTLLERRCGLKPAMVRWLYLSVIRPMMTYESYVPSVPREPERSFGHLKKHISASGTRYGSLLFPFVHF